ncbi:MAG: DUF4157 domain-containing protein [Anaerolineae bacterium]|nr:DUF4157 domain-containing protein [Anaerolineae bacterium]MCB0205379.1 DUF4157 domain-containing protein [Anaerolineae bacterium]
MYAATKRTKQASHSATAPATRVASSRHKNAKRVPSWAAGTKPATIFGVERGIQAKLAINEPGDVYEQEADRVAEQVMRIPESQSGSKRCACGGVAGPDGECAACGAKWLGVQRHASATPVSVEAPPIVHDVLRAPGQPLDAGMRTWMESRFGHDFSGVRLHTNRPAAQSAASVGARAYTVGQSVVFGDSEYAPGTSEGQKLLAHELAHVVQQGNRPGIPQTKSAISQPGEPQEQEADRVAQTILAGGRMGLNGAPAWGGKIQKAATPFWMPTPSVSPADSPRLWRKPKGEVTLGEPEINTPEPQQEQKEERVRFQVFAVGMDAAALALANWLTTTASRAAKYNYVFIGLHPKFVKVYNQAGKSLGGRIALKKVKGLHLKPGVYILGPGGRMEALTVSTKDRKLGVESGGSIIGQRPFTAKEKAAIAEDAKKAEAEGRQPAPAPTPTVDVIDLLTEPERLRSMVASVPNAQLIYFVPTYEVSGGGKSGGESKNIYASPIETRGDGQPANAPPWPVAAQGPKLVPTDSSPTYSAKVDWTANGNYTIASQVISQVGETIHYRWELFDITRYAKQQMAKDPASTKDGAAPTPEKSLEERIEEFKKSKAGTGTDVTGMGAANREFSREFEDWWKDTKRAAKGAVDPGGDTVRERLSNAAANRLSLELAPVSLLTTAVGAALKWLAELFAGPRQQQEINLKKAGIFLVRVITTPAINEDREGKPIIRPPSVAAKVTEVTPMDRAVRESLDEPRAQLAELQAQIDLADKAGNTPKAEYLRSLLAEAKLRFEGSPLSLLIKQRAKKQQDLDEFRKKYPTLSDYSRVRDIEMLDDQIALYKHHEKDRTAGATGLAPMQRLNATLISEVTGEQYPLLLSAGPMAMEDGKYQWMISDVTNREGDAFTGLGDKPSEAFYSALTKFGGKAAYGRGRIGVRTAGLALEAGALAEMLVNSAPTNWALAEKRIDDLVTTLAALGLIVASAGTASAVIGAAVAATRLIERWQAGKLYLDAQAVSDVLGVLGGMGAAGQLAAGLRVQKFETVFAITQEGRATESQLVRAAEALKGAQNLAKAVEAANEAINYGGLLWGNVSFIDQMMSINEQERSGAITHAEARRSRATAISSAVQNNGLFIAGNVIKAKQAAAKEKTASPPEKTPVEKTPTETTTPGEKTTPQDTVPPESLPKEKAPSDETSREDADKLAGKTPQPEPVPIGERRATPAELQAALPADLRGMLIVDDSLHGDSVQAEYKLDSATGLISEIHLRCGPDARPSSVSLHTETIRTMQKYQGFSGRVRQAISWVGDKIGFEALNPEKNPVAFEAALEIRKLPKLIDAQMARMKNLEPNARDLAEAELENLQNQLEKHLRTLGFAEGGEVTGIVAAKGLSKAKQKQYAELRTKLRTHKAGSDPHKAIRWEMYQLTGGDMPYSTWEKVYYSNQERHTKASVIEAAEQKKLGWGELQLEVDVPGGGKRRLDIGEETAATKRAVEVKAYESGKVYARGEILDEVNADGKLIRYRGWKITWRFIDCEPSGPLTEALQKAGITIEIRWRKGQPAEQITIILPPQKKKVKK